MKELIEIILHPLRMIYNFLGGERDILYKPKKQKDND